MNHQPVDVLVEARKLFPVFSRVGAFQQPAHFNGSVHRRRVVGIEVDMLYMSNMRRGGKAPLRHAGHRTKRRHFAPMEAEIVAGEEVRRLGAGKQTHAPFTRRAASE